MIISGKEPLNVQFYSWNFGDGQKSSLPDPSSTYINPGSFDVSLIVIDKNNCSDTTTLEKLVNVGGPYGNFSLGSQQLLCTNDSLSFDGQTQNASFCQWDFGDGNVETSETVKTKHLYESAGAYKVALILIDDKGCKVSAKGDVRITIMKPTPVGFHNPPCVFENDVLTLQTQTNEGNLSFKWEIDGIATSQESVITIPADAPGKRDVTLYTTNANGCVSDSTQTISINGYIEEIPNVFTPNGNDNLNADFQILGIEHSAWDLYVYNRWGRPVYEKIKYDNTWNGDDLPAGVYYYTLQNNICPDKKYKGIVSILR